VTLGGRLLLIDDDWGTCETLGDVLRLRGHAVEVATRGREGLDKLAKSSFDATIVDIQLPDISGLALLEAIKASSPDTEVIFITGHASLPTALQALNGGAYGYLVKPFEMDHLLATVARALEKEHLARALRESEERYRLITETMRDAVFLLDLEGRVILANPGGSSLTGRPAEQLRGRPLVELFIPEGARRACELLAAGRAASLAFETQVIREDGRRVWVEAIIARIVKAGQVVAHLGVCRDLTDRRKAEEARREADTLRAIAELARATAHEINNPLAVLILAVDRLRSRDLSEAQRAEWFRAVEEASLRIRDIVERLNHITRREVDARLPEWPMLDIRRSSDAGRPAARQPDLTDSPLTRGESVE
jgi:PAS domain S-box-containing protein